MAPSCPSMPPLLCPSDVQASSCPSILLFLCSWGHILPLHPLLQLPPAPKLLPVSHSCQQWGELPPAPPAGLPPSLNPAALITLPQNLLKGLVPVRACPPHPGRQDPQHGEVPRCLGCFCASPRPPPPAPPSRQRPCKRLHIFHMYKKSLGRVRGGGLGWGAPSCCPPSPPRPGFGPFFWQLVFTSVVKVTSVRGGGALGR